MNTKGDLSINIIIVTVIALLVLAVIAFLIFGLPEDVESANACKEALGGECVSVGTCDGIPLSQGVCEGEGQVCCRATS